MITAFLGLGSNLGDSPSLLAAALRSINEVAEVGRVSSLYRTEPVGGVVQPDFYNLVCQVFTDLGPDDLLRHILEVENRMGRLRTVRFGPRLIDIDLLSHGGWILDSPELILPHPRMGERAFVLVPLREIAPEWRHPVSGASADELLRAAGDRTRLERIGPMPFWRSARDSRGEP
ncbi:MAG: 2-amino-4-hydroxy-6-hydroxymethyldihydropteridine diphosphokinase [Gemmatimonadota bacterium]|jgi:2-amino-4-hydroxy-6-hydroxymethyldihydropteridine diphosphokinase|nr:2-amino-4-hydroxy-6-hydroxymethyldihydropteridine diphosphokinase [Gemmatimonadota bacterium]